MTYNLVIYRTEAYPYNQHALVPALYLSDLRIWLKSVLNATIVKVTDNYRASLSGKLKVIAPEAWSAYDECKRYVHTVNVLSEVARVW